MRKISLEGMKRKLFISIVSCVLIAAKDGEATPMYKYDYRAIVFGESASEILFARLNASLLRCVFYDLSYNVLIKSYDNRIIRAG